MINPFSLFGIELLLDVAKEANVLEKIEAMFRGDKINNTENRPVWHVQLTILYELVTVVNAQKSAKVSSFLI